MLYVWVSVLVVARGQALILSRYEEHCCYCSRVSWELSSSFSRTPLAILRRQSGVLCPTPEALSETCCFGQKRKLRGHGMNGTVDPSECVSHPIFSSMMLARRCPWDLVPESVFGVPLRG